MSEVGNVLGVEDQQWELAVQREAVVRPLVQKSALRPEDVAAACGKLGIKQAFLYRLIGRYKKSSRTSALLPGKRGRRVGTLQLKPEVAALVEASIKRWYLTSQKPKISKLERLIALEASKAGVRKPSRRAIERRIANIDLKRLLEAREGPEVARDKVTPVSGQFTAVRPLEIVQVDHTRVDVFVVDERHRLPI